MAWGTLSCTRQQGPLALGVACLEGRAGATAEAQVGAPAEPQAARSSAGVGVQPASTSGLLLLRQPRVRSHPAPQG